MRLLRLILFFFLISALISIPASGQSSPPQQQTQSTTTQAPQSALDGDFVRNPFLQQSAGQNSGAPELKPLPRFKIKVLPRKIQKLKPHLDVFTDPGIYLRKSDLLGSACGSIVSYNFSTGDNPRLESITTCTPAGIVQSRRAGDEDNKPPARRVVQTKY